MAGIKKLLADFRTSLSAKIAVAGTSGSIQNNLDDDGVALPNGSYYFTLDADNAQKEHITCTLTGSNLTDIYSVSRQGVETSGTVREHRIGATVSITDFAHILVHNKILNGDEALINKIKYATDLTFTDDKELIPKKYADDLAIAGSPDATTTTKGIVLMSTAPASPTAPTALNSEEVTATPTANKVPRADATGKVDSGYISAGTSSGLEAGTNGTQVKIKTSGGLVRDTNGLSVDVGTTTGKIVQMATGDKLPAVDGSQLTGIANNTITSFLTSGGNFSFSDPRKTQLAFDPDGNSFYIAGSVGTYPNLGVTIYKYSKDPLTGIFYYAGVNASLSQSGGDFGGGYGYIGITVGANYVWFTANNNANNNIVIIRLTKSLGGKQVMTISGTANSSYDYAYFLAGNDSTLYVTQDGATNNGVSQYSISGTTATRGSTITLTSANFNSNCYGFYADASYFYYLDYSSNPVSIKKYPLAGGSVTSSTPAQFFSGDTASGTGGIPVGISNTSDNNTLYITGVNVTGYYNGGAWAKTGGILTGYRITKP
jgi:hypothetical protein